MTTGVKIDLSRFPVFSVEPTDPDFFHDPYRAYARMHQIGGPFVWDQYGYLCFAGYEAVNSILRDRRFGREIAHVMSREEARLGEIPGHLKAFHDFEANSMLEREPPVHTRLRRLVNRAFVSRRIEALAPAIETLCLELINDFPDDAAFDLLPSYCEIIPVYVIADLLGVPRSMSPQLLDWSHKMVAMYQFNRSREIEDTAVTATAQFAEYITAIAMERREDPRDDLLTALVEAQSGGDHLSMDELVTTAILLLNAGHEATVHAIGNGVKALLENPGGTDLVLSGEKARAAAIEELLRIDPPLHLFTRYVLEDMEFQGTRLQRGQTVGLLLGAANHDPVRYARPRELDVKRGGAGHVSFGAGIHFCLGAPLARLEMDIALRVLFEREPDLCLVGKPAYADRFHFHGLEKLMVAATCAGSPG